MRRSPLCFGGVMLPSQDVDLTKFATVACDQFTSDPDYWRRLDALVGDSPSSLRITYPEIYLNDNRSARIAGIEAAMNRYLESGVFREQTFDAVLTERLTPYSPPRLGLVASVNLDDYTYSGAPAAIRATEGTVTERIPPRVEIRSGCRLELPHVMLLVEDEEGLLVEAAHAARGEKLYDFELNMGGGHLTGYRVENLKATERAAEILLEKSVEKYGAPFLFAVGDGNHSLAAAKAVYEKSRNQMAGRALAEIVNVYSPGIIFHPIHRLVSAARPLDFIAYLKSATENLPVISRLYHDGQTYTYRLPENGVEGVKLIQELTDGYGGAKVADYVHGRNQLEAASKGEFVGVELGAMDKSQLFKYVHEHGALPRKTFSMGEGEEKRYYLEARRIR